MLTFYSETVPKREKVGAGSAGFLILELIVAVQLIVLLILFLFLVIIIFKILFIFG
jgi:hypothetical protein